MNGIVQLYVNLNAPFLKHNIRMTMKLTKEQNQAHCLKKKIILGKKKKKVLAGTA